MHQLILLTLLDSFLRHQQSFEAMFYLMFQETSMLIRQRRLMRYHREAWVNESEYVSKLSKQEDEGEKKKKRKRNFMKSYKHI